MTGDGLALELEMMRIGLTLGAGKMGDGFAVEAEMLGDERA